ncbi:hypothetical protein KJ684_01120 [Patescibacteria group bacterium]|nr:hypothetical protein [Patescibacteria group bacterium]
MEETEQERDYKSTLIQSRSKPKTKFKGASILSPEFAIGSAEMLLVLGAAIILDLLDLLDLTVFGSILVRFIDIPMTLAIYMWLKSKDESMTPLKNPGFKIVLVFLAEISPFGMIPMWSAFVIYVWLKQSKPGRKKLSKIIRERRKK